MNMAKAKLFLFSNTTHIHTQAYMHTLYIIRACTCVVCVE